MQSREIRLALCVDQEAHLLYNRHSMDKDPDKFRPPPSGEELERAKRLVLDKSIELFTSELGADPLLLQPLLPEHTALYRTGLPRFDEELAKQTEATRGHPIAEIKADIAIIISEKSELSYSFWTETLKDRLKIDPKWSEIRARQRGLGLRLSEVFAHVQAGMAFTYFPESMGNRLMTTLNDDDLVSALGQLPDSPPTGYELALALRDKGAYDDELELLDERILHAYGLAQLTAVQFILGDLKKIAYMGGERAAWARKTFEEYRSRLFIDDIESKRTLLKLIQHQFESYAQMEKDPALNQFINEYAEGTARVAQHFGDFIGVLPYIYQKYDLPLPQFLESIEPVRVGTRKPRESLTIDQFNSEIISLREKARELFGGIALSKNARRHRGFERLENGLIRGFRTADQGKIPARQGGGQHVNVLSAIADLAEDFGGEGGAHGVEELKAYEMYLTHQWDDLMRRAKVEGLPVEKLEPLATFPFIDFFDDIAERWPGTLMTAVRDLWPNGEGPIIAQRIDELLAYNALSKQELHLPPEPTGSMTKEQVLGGVEVKRLHEVFFPKGGQKLSVQQAKEAADRVIRDRRAHNTGESSGESVTTWDRVYDLITVCNDEMFEAAEFYETNPEERIFGEKESWFVAILTTRRGTRIIMAEHPSLDNATYIFPDIHMTDPEPYGWKEVFTTFLRTDARALGAHYIIHSRAAPHGPKHVEKMLKKARELDLAPLVFTPEQDSSELAENL